MARGVPVVSRNIGFNGLDISSGEGVILALETETFAAACITLLESEALRRHTGEQGRAVIRSRFDWDVVAARLETYFRDLQRH